MTTGVLSAAVSNPDVQAGSLFFQYGTSNAYGSGTADQALAAQSGASNYAASLSGLQPGTTYHFRVVTTNPDGTVYGPDEVFTTAAAPAPAPSTPTSPSPSPSTPSSSSPAPPSDRFTFGKATVASGGKVTLPVTAPDAGRFTAKATFTVRSTVITHQHGKRVVKHVTKTYTYGTANVRSTGKGTFKLVFALSASAARELKALGIRQVTFAVTFTPAGGKANRETKQLTIKRSAKGKYS